MGSSFIKKNKKKLPAIAFKRVKGKKEQSARVLKGKGLEKSCANETDPKPQEVAEEGARNVVAHG